MLSDKVMVVDDDPRVISSVKLVFPEYEILGFQDGERALEFLRKPNDVSLVLLDVFIRNVNGINILNEIKQLEKNIAVVIMTAFGSMDLAVQALRYKADDFIEKPFNIDELKDKVRAVLKQKTYTDKFIRSDDEKIERIKRFVQRNYTDVSLEHIADELCLSIKYISRMFKEKNKGNFRDYKLAIKIEKAKALLEKSSHNVTQIAYQMGYQNPESFMRIFKKITRYTPSQYRKKFQKKRKFRGSLRVVQ